MKKGMVVTLAMLFCVVLPISAHAEMKIAPSGVTSPDDSAAIHLSGALSTGGSSEVPDGAIISSVNTYSGSFQTYGGYFKVAGYYGKGVYCFATGPAGTGVLGYASGTYGTGVFGSAGGSQGVGVYGKAPDPGVGTNYGGIFEASSTLGRGVYGKATNAGNVTNYGGYFEASGSDGRGVYGKAMTSGDVANYGGYFVSAGYYGAGVYGAGTKYDFFAGGSGNYGPFTGSHEVKIEDEILEEISPGMIVSVTGNTEVRINEGGEIALSSTMPTVKVSSEAKDKAIFGVLVSEGPLPKNHWYEAREGERFGVVNALGEGRVWVTNCNGNIEAGDYITTSEIPGYGQLQDDDLLHSYTLGKAIETIDWGQVTETVQHEGKIYKCYLMALVYTSG